MMGNLKRTEREKYEDRDRLLIQTIEELKTERDDASVLIYELRDALVWCKMRATFGLSGYSEEFEFKQIKKRATEALDKTFTESGGFVKAVREIQRKVNETIDKELTCND